MKAVHVWHSFWNLRIAPGLIVVACLLVLQIYAVRALLAAELLFALAFVFVAVLGAGFYFIGSVAERGADAMESGLRPIVPLVRHGCHDLEEASRKWIGSARNFCAHR